MIGTDAYEAKGLWFVAIRKFVVAEYGEPAFAEIVGRVEPQFRPIVEGALASRWYPERALAQPIAAMFEVLAGGDEGRFLAIMESGILFGIHRFFRSLIGLGTPAFVLRRIPTLWHLVRRGPAVVDVHVDATRALIHYDRFPFFDHVSYRLGALGIIRALVGLCREVPSGVHIISHNRMSMALEVTYPMARVRTPREFAVAGARFRTPAVQRSAFTEGPAIHAM